MKSFRFALAAVGLFLAPSVAITPPAPLVIQASPLSARAPTRSPDVAPASASYGRGKRVAKPRGRTTTGAFGGKRLGPRRAIQHCHRIATGLTYNGALIQMKRQ